MESTPKMDAEPEPDANFDGRAEPERARNVQLGGVFLRLWATQMLSIVGSILSAVGVAVAVYLDTGSEAWLGVLAGATAIPSLLISPFLGMIDRFPRRTVMLAGDSLAAVGPIIALSLALTGRLAPWQLAIAAFVGAFGSAIQTPATMAAVPLLVDRAALDRANGLLQFGPATGIVLGPILATPLVAAGGIVPILIIDVATFLLAVAVTAVTPFRPPSETGDHHPTDAAAGGADDDADERERKAGRPTEEGTDGRIDDRTWSTAWTWLRGPGRGLLALLAVMATINFGLAFFNVAVLAVATSVGGPERAGLALGVGGIATIVGSIWVGSRGLSDRRTGTIAVGVFAAAVGAAIIGSRPSFVVVMAGAAIALGGVPAVNAAVSTLFHERVPETMQGRVFGLRSAIGQALHPVGSVLSGFVIAGLLAPAMTEGGALANTLGSLIGRGPERGAAAMLVGVGVWLVGTAVAVRISGTIRSLDDGDNDDDLARDRNRGETDRRREAHSDNDPITA